MTPLGLLGKIPILKLWNYSKVGDFFDAFQCLPILYVLKLAFFDTFLLIANPSSHLNGSVFGPFRRKSFFRPSFQQKSHHWGFSVMALKREKADPRFYFLGGIYFTGGMAVTKTATCGLLLVFTFVQHHLLPGGIAGPSEAPTPCESGVPRRLLCPADPGPNHFLRVKGTGLGHACDWPPPGPVNCVVRFVELRGRLCPRDPSSCCMLPGQRRFVPGLCQNLCVAD